MKNYVQEHFDNHREPVRPAIVCADGAIYSVQASSFHYCSPKEDYCENYASVEVWRRDKVTRVEPEGWVPIDRINKRIHRHGGPIMDDP